MRQVNQSSKKDKTDHLTLLLIKSKDKEDKRFKSMIERKPDLKVYPNHKKYIPLPNRYWDSLLYGVAYRDNNGWYIQNKK